MGYAWGIGNWQLAPGKNWSPCLQGAGGAEIRLQENRLRKAFSGGNSSAGENSAAGKVSSPYNINVSSKKVFGGTGKSSTLNAGQHVLLGTSCLGCIGEYSKSGQTNKSTWLLHASALSIRGR